MDKIINQNVINVGFMVPSGWQNHDPFRNIPITILYLMTILEDHFGDRIKLSLFDLRGMKEDAFIYHIPEQDIYMYSLTTRDYNEAGRYSKELRQHYPKAKHVAGGPHISLFPEECSKDFDVIVLRDGEESIINVVEDFMANKLKSRYTQDRVVDFDQYPFPRRKWLPATSVAIKGFLNKEYSELLGTAVVFSRGCPFDCHFCGNLESGRVMFRSQEKIEQEINYLKKEYGIQALALKDDNGIPVGRKQAQPLLEAIGRSDIKWRGQSRPVGVLPDMAKLAKQAGCVEVAVGLESASEKVLSIVNKSYSYQKARDYLRLLREIDLPVRLHFIIGLPGETNAIVEETIKIIEEINPKSVLASILSLIPGSVMYSNPERFAMKLHNDFDHKVVYGSFDENEKPIMNFEYLKDAPWGKALSTEEIINNYLTLQTYLRERNLRF